LDLGKKILLFLNPDTRFLFKEMSHVICDLVPRLIRTCPVIGFVTVSGDQCELVDGLGGVVDPAGGAFDLFCGFEFSGLVKKVYEILPQVYAVPVACFACVAVRGDVISKGDAYIGEFSTIEGRLTVFGDLEIGRNVRIKNGFEAKGLITIQDPMPIIMFIFLYILELLRLGRLEDVEKLFEAEEFVSPLEIPENTTLNIDVIKTSKDVLIEGSRVLGNIRAKNVIAKDCELYGSIRGRDVVVDNSRVHGVIEGREVYLVNNSTVLGQIKAEKVFMEEGCVVEGSIVGKSGVWIKPSVEVPSFEEAEKEEVEEIEE